MKAEPSNVTTKRALTLATHWYAVLASECLFKRTSTNFVLALPQRQQAELKDISSPLSDARSLSALENYGSQANSLLRTASEIITAAQVNPSVLVTSIEALGRSLSDERWLGRYPTSLEEPWFEQYNFQGPPRSPPSQIWRETAGLIMRISCFHHISWGQHLSDINCSEFHFRVERGTAQISWA